MTKKKKTYTCLIDMDCILVDMLPPWLARYNEICGTNVRVSDIEDYNVGTVCENTEVLYKILDEDGFFFNMEPMAGAVEGLQALRDDGYNIVIVTQPPRIAELAVRDKRRWILKHFPDFDLTDMIFCHHKEMVRGDLILDDKPAHLINWKKANPNGIVATLDWKFSRLPEVNSVVHFRGALGGQGWMDFVDFVRHIFPLK